MKAISQTYYDHPVKRVPLKSPVKDEPVPVEEAHTKKRKSIAPPPGSTKKKKVAPKNDAWTKIYKGVLRDLPKKYQTKGENLKRLEIVWRTVENKTVSFNNSIVKTGLLMNSQIIEKGAVLSDIVKVCGCSVLQANECLGTLIKLKLVQRHKAKQSLLYQSVPR